MAHSTVSFENNGLIKVAPIGFSWTTFLFGGFPALLRGHAVIGLVQIVLQVITFSFSAVIFAFIYNKMYVNYLLDNGYRFESVQQGKTQSEIESELGMKLLSRS